MVTWARMAVDFERIGLAVAGLGPVSSTERLAENTSLFAAITGQPRRAAALIQESMTERQRIAETVARFASDKPQLLFLITAGHGQWRVGHGFADIITEAGGYSLAKTLSYGVLDAEELLLLSPDVIILMGGSWLQTNAPSELTETPFLAPIPAIKNRRVYQTPQGLSGYMASVLELPIYLQWLAETLHPLETDHHVRDLARRIYATDLGLVPTDGELDEALAVAVNRHSAFQGASEQKQ